MLLLIEAEWCINASVQHTVTNIGSDNNLSPVQHQAIIWTNAAIVSIEPQGTYSNENLFKIQQVPIHGNALENVVCEMVAILSRLQYVNVNVNRKP